MDRIDEITLTTLQRTDRYGADVFDQGALVDKLNEMVGAINRLQENWERVSGAFERVADAVDDAAGT